MSFQFIHIQCIARAKPKKVSTGSDTKWTVSDIAGEAMRSPENSPHVKDPSPPVIVFGIDAFQVAAEAEKRAEASKDVMDRKIRMDTPIMLAGVASHPVAVSDLIDPEKRAEYEFWKKETMSFLRKKYGENLLSVIEHLDEKQPHLHFYVVPEAGIGFNAKKMHDGFVAGAAAGKNSPLQKQLYSDGMRSFQDSYHAAVGVKCGQARLGPKRQRLTRARWLEQKTTMARTAKAFQRLGDHIKSAVAKAEKKAADIVSAAKETAKGSGLKIGSFFDGLKGNANQLIKRLKEEVIDLEAKKKVAEAAKRDAESARKSAFESKDAAIYAAVEAAKEPLQAKVNEERDFNRQLNEENKVLAETLRLLQLDKFK